jgi:glycosyltransferase involved in cell wall biosynthesis
MKQDTERLDQRWLSRKASVNYPNDRQASESPLVSIITPTRDRKAFHPAIWNCVRSQEYSNIEWLVEDDSESESQFLSDICDPRLRYVHLPHRHTVGAKRNSLVFRSKGSYIVHFDDDDYYSPSYITQIVTQLAESGADISKLSAYFVYDARYKRHFYWDQDDVASQRFFCKPQFPLVYLPPNPLSAMDHRLGFGFSYAYRREIAIRLPFDDIDLCEDLYFMQRVSKGGTVLFISDDVGLCVHVIHDANLSGCFPQFVVPQFMVDRMFPDADYIVSRNNDRERR